MKYRVVRAPSAIAGPALVRTPTSGVAPFRPRARLIRLLGDELISHEVMAVVELVNNAYDAEARQVTVGLYDLANPDAARIEIHDDGTGMSLDTVLHAWLEPFVPITSPSIVQPSRAARGRDSTRFSAA